MKRFFEEYGAVCLAAIATTIIIAIVILVGGRVQTGTGGIFNSFVNSKNDIENSVVYKIEYESVSGKSLGVSSVTGVLGSTKEVTPANKVGYTAPGSQNITWDSGTKTIKFVYTPIEYNITYDLGGGTHTNPATYNIESPNIELKAPSRTGHNFAGWTADDITSPQVDVTIKTGSHGDKKYIANWAVQSYKYNIVYESSTGKVLGTSDITKQFGTSNTIAAPEKTGYVTPKTQTVEWDTTSAKTIKFIYTPIEYKINYSLDGGTLGNNPISSYNIESSNIKIPTPSKKGHTFNGWTGSNGNSPQKDVTITTGSTGDKNYTASWGINRYTLTFNVNGGSAISETSRTLNFGQAYGALPTPTRAEYDFTGWYTAATGGTKVTDKTTMDAANKTIFAQWKLKEYQAYFNGNGGSDGTTITKGYNLKLGQLPSSSRNGYTFTGWYTDKAGGTKISSETLMPSGGATYYAHWDAKQTQYKVTHQLMELDGINYADVIVENLAGKTDESVTPSVKTYEGFTAPQTQTVKIKADGSTNVVYKYSRNLYNLVLNQTKGYVYDKTSDVSNEYYFDSTVNIKGASQTGYRFIGWDVVGSSKINLDNTPNVSFKMPALNSTLDRVVITPQVAMQNYSISYDLAGGSVSGNPYSYNIESQTITLKNPTKAGYTFLGWTGSNGTTPQTTVQIPAGSTGNKSYTANWKVNTYTLTYNANGGSVSPTSKTINYGEAYGTLPTPTKTGYNFTGWYTAPTGGSKVTETTKITGNTTIYAQWGIGKYSITINYKFENGSEAANQIYAVLDYGKDYSFPSPAVTGHTPDKATVSGKIGTTNLVVDVIYRPNTYTYKTVFKSNTGKVLEEKTISGKFGSTQTVTPTDKTGYVTPKAQTVVFDSVSQKTIQFTYNIINRRVDFVTLSNQTVSPLQFNVETASVTFPTASKTGYTFNGWVLEEGAVRNDLQTTSQSCNGTKTPFTISKPQVLIGHVNNQAERSASVWIVNKADNQTVETNYGNYLVANLEPGNYEIVAALGSCSDAGSVQLFDVILKDRQYISSIKGTDYNKDITVYASYTPNNYTYNINYVSSSGKSLGTSTVTGAFNSYKQITPPVKTGYTTPVRQNVRFDSTSAKTITFTYPPISYSIVYNLNGGSVSGNPTSFNIESNPITLKNPTRAGYIFTGWTGSNGSTAQTSVNIPTGSTGNKTYTANWKEITYQLASGGTVNKILRDLDVTKPIKSIEFTDLVKPSSGVISINGLDADNDNGVVGWYTVDSNNNSEVFISTQKAGQKVIANSNSFGMFDGYDSNKNYRLDKIETINASKLDTSRVTNMTSMFNRTGFNAKTFKIIGLNQWDVSNVTSMSAMFQLAGYNATTFDIVDLSNWNTGKVTTMAYMFNQSGYNATEWYIGDIGRWNVSNVEYIQYMFSYAGSRDSTWFIGHLDNWKVDKVTNMKSMFYYAGRNNATTWDIGNLDNWNVSNVTDMAYMFNDTGVNATKWNVGNLSNWNVSNVKDMSFMFCNAGMSATSWDVGQLTNWNTSKVTNMKHMFRGAANKASAFNIGNLSSWDTSNVTDMSYMFEYTAQNVNTFNIGNIGNWNLAKVNTIRAMFAKAGYKATEWYIGDLSNWQVGNVTDMAYLFQMTGTNVPSWSVGNLKNWNTSNVTNMQAIFQEAGKNSTSWYAGDLSGWQTGKVTTMQDMFSTAGSKSTNFNVGNISNWNTSNLTNMQGIFYFAGKYGSNSYIIDLSNWDASKVTNMSYSFYYPCANRILLPKNIQSTINMKSVIFSTWYDYTDGRKAYNETIPTNTGGISHDMRLN